MNRISKTLGLSLCGLVLAVNSVRAETPATSEPQLDAGADAYGDPSVTEGAIKFTIISASAFAGGASAGFAFQQQSNASARTDVHSRSAFSGSGDRAIFSHPEPNNLTVGETVLRGTSPGDIIRLEYIAGTEAALQQAVADLRQSVQSWEYRIRVLTRDRADLVQKVSDSRELYTALTKNGASEGQRYLALTEMTNAETSIKILDRTLADADMRWRSSRAQLGAAARNLEATSRTHMVNQRFHIVQDILVDSSRDQIRQVLTRTMGETYSAAQARAAVPHVRITRVLVADSALVKYHMQNVKFGLLMAGVTAALILEEVTVGAISQKLTENAQQHYAPNVRIEPSGASGRRN